VHFQITERRALQPWKRLVNLAKATRRKFDSGGPNIFLETMQLRCARDRNHPNPEFFKRRQDFLFWLSPPKRVFALECSDRLNRVCATNGPHTCLRKPEMLNLPLLDQVLHRSPNIFDWNVRVDAMLIETISDISLKALQ